MIHEALRRTKYLEHHNRVHGETSMTPHIEYWKIGQPNKTHRLYHYSQTEYPFVIPRTAVVDGARMVIRDKKGGGEHFL